jgi:hypothetical protein
MSRHRNLRIVCAQKRELPLNKRRRGDDIETAPFDNVDQMPCSSNSISISYPSDPGIVATSSSSKELIEFDSEDGYWPEEVSYYNLRSLDELQSASQLLEHQQQQSLSPSQSDDDNDDNDDSDDTPIDEAAANPVNVTPAANVANEIQANVEETLLGNQFRLEFPGFHFRDELFMMKELYCKKNGKPDNSKDAFLPGSMHTREDVAYMLDKFIRQNSLTVKTENELVQLLHQLIPNANLPVRHCADGKTVESNIASFTTNVHKDILFDFDYCSELDFVYVGEGASLKSCPKCGTHRFKACDKRECWGKSYEECTHNVSQRMAKRSFVYRSVLGIIIELIQFDSFLEALEFRNADSVPGLFTDVLDGEVAKKHMKEMQIQAEKYCDAKKDTLKDITCVNLLLGQFYDGAQVYKAKASSFYPLLFHILNLPPDMRKVLGGGKFCYKLIFYFNFICKYL